MRTATAAFSVALLILVLAVSTASAAPAEVNVRIEGRSETLFEGPILTDGHNVRASSDTKAPQGGRRCNGLNNGANPTPGPTPTAASVDAMSILGEGFDGRWYGEPFEDYFIKRWGPDGQDDAKGEYWGLVVNNVFTSVGGCQYQLDGGDEVLWIYGAFGARPRLALYPADYAGGPQQLTATAELGEDFEVEVDAWSGYNEGEPPPSPQRSGSSPFEGAEVATVTTNGKGFERVDTESLETATTGPDGRASISFDEPGWHRIKATQVNSAGEEVAIRSNRLDVCVLEPPASDCGPPPPEDDVRIPPPPQIEEPGPEGPGDGGPGAGAGPLASGPGPAAATVPPAPGQVRLQLPRLDRSRIGQGLVKLSWRVIDAGPGIARWTISSKRLGRGGSSYVVRATGAKATSALLRLPPGAAYQVRITITDALGRSSTASVGRVQVPA